MMMTQAAASQKHLAPSLIIPGAGKSGTSTLFEHLGLHPDIQMASIKEPHVYSLPDRYARRFDPDFETAFPRLFSANLACRYRGEASTTYMVCPEAPRRIFADVPDAKIIFIFRNPLDRIVSHYNWLRGMGLALKSFREEIEEDIAVPFDSNCDIAGNYKHYVGESRYGTHMLRYLSIFPRENIHVMSFERLKRDPVQTMAGCFEFLSLCAPDQIMPIHSNRTQPTKIDGRPLILRRLQAAIPDSLRGRLANVPGARAAYRRTFYRQLPPYAPTRPERNWLVDLLRDEVRELETLLGVEFAEWTDFRS